MTEELEDAVDSQLAKYLTSQSGYMAIIFMILIPFVKTMILSDFAAIVPIENIIFTGAFLAMLIIANYKDKKQEHNNAASALTTPKTTESFLDGMEKIAEGIKATQADDIKMMVKEFVKELDLQPRIVEKIIEVPVDRIIYVEKPDNITDVAE